jgi:hypothetical protein
MFRGRSAGIIVLAVSASVVGLLPATAWASPRHEECVGPRPGCAATLSAAIAAAPDGGTIRLGPGRYRGGVTIAKSLHLVGAGQRRTAIVGGRSVVTVTRRADGSIPTVTMADLALTGGTAVAADGYEGFGGGLDIPSTDAGKVGATVALTRVWVHGNRATATSTSPSPSGVLCPRGYCPFALAAGGGILNSGHLTVVDSRIDHNAADGRVSDADGGGIYTATGSLRLVDSVVADNQARPAGIGRFAEGGGVFVESGGVHITGTAIVRNSADLVTSWPVDGQGVVINMNANSGGIHIGDDAHGTISRTRVVGNRAIAVDPAGEPAAFDSALLIGNSTIAVDRSQFVGNSVYANAATDVDAGFSGTAVEFDAGGRMTRSLIADNRATSVSNIGPAAASDGLAVYQFYDTPIQLTVTDTVITGNRATAYSKTDAATVTGAGVINNSLLDMTRVLISRNSVHAGGPSATAQGGGIWNGVLLSGPPVRLRLSHVRVTANSASTGPGGLRQGGGLYTTLPVFRTATLITDNRPDNFFRANP